MSIAIKRNFTIPSTSSIGASEISLSSSTASTSVNTGAIVSLGGAGISGAISLGGPLKLYNGNYYTGFDSAATANTTYIWPATSPATGTSVLSSDAAGNLSWILMSASGSGFTLNNLTASTQYFSTSISGVGFTISSIGSTHTFNIGLAGNASTGLISSASQTLFGLKTFGSGVAITSGTASTSTTTGDLTVTGGVGIGGSLNVQTLTVGSGVTGLIIQKMVGANYAAMYSTNVTPSGTNYTFITDGQSPNFNGTFGVYFNISNSNKVQITNTNINITPTTASTSTSTGSLTVVGGVGVGGSLWTATTNFSSISGVGHSNSVITSGVWSGTAISAVNGGTGLTSYTTGDILYASSSTSLGKITAGSAGSILTSAGTGSTPYWSAPSSTGVTSLAASTGISVNASTGAVTVTNTGLIALTGTANQVLVNGGSGSATSGNVTLTTPQSIGTASSPSFADVTLSTGSNSTLAAVGSAPTSMVNKQYVDNLASGLDIHKSIRVLQASAIGASYVQTQVAGFAATSAYLISTTQTALPAIDGVTISATGTTQRILITGGFTGNAIIGGTTPFTPGNSFIGNGVYYVGALGGSGTSNWILIRATDSDDNIELTGGTFTFIEEGSSYADTGWVCSNDTTNLGPIQFGSTAISFTQFSGGGALSAGQGLNKVSNTIASKINISSIGTASGTGYTQFNLGGTSGGGTADTGYYPTFGVRTSGTIAGSAILTLNSDGFSLLGSTNLNRTITVTGSDITLTGGGNTLTLTGSISLPSPTANGIAYGSSSSAISFLIASGSGASVLTQTSGSVPSYLSQSQLVTGGATTSARWQTSRTVTFSGGGVTGSFSIDGSANVSGIALTVTDDSIALGTKTTGQYATTIAISGSGITATSASASDGTAYTIYSSAVSTNTSSSIVLRDSSGNFSAGTITGTLSGTATSAVNAGFAGAATTAVNAGFAGAATTANSAGSAGTSVNSGFAGAATTATNAGFAGSSTNAANTNITLDTTSTIYLTGSRSNASIGSTPVYVLSGVSALGNTIAATTFSGTATSAVNAGFAGAATTAISAGSAGTAVNAGLSGLATNLAGGTIGALHYQSASNASGFISYPGAGYALTSVGAGTSSVWQLLSAMTVGSATTATNAGFAGAATTATNAGSAGTSVNAGFAGAATTATNAGFAGAATTATNAGSAGTAINAGFAGAATTAVNAGLAGLANNLSGGTQGALHYQSATNTSGFISYPGAGYALTSVGSGTSAVWQTLSTINVGSATTATSAGSAGTAVNAGFAGAATTAINAGFAGAATTATNAGFAGSSTNTANTNIILDTTSTIYLTGSRSNASIGSTPVYVLSGVSALGNTVTATTFSGTATTATNTANTNIVLDTTSTIYLTGSRSNTSTGSTAVYVLSGVSALGNTITATTFTGSLSGTASSAALVNVAASTGTRFLAGFSLNTATGSTQIFTGSGITIGDNRLTTGGLAVTAGAASTNTLTGALTVAGGVGITGQLSVNTIALGSTGVSITPSMTYVGTAGTVISMSVLSDTTIAWEGTSGQLFSIDNNLSSGEIFSVSDISGLPVITASAGQTITLNEFGGFTQVGNGLASTSTSTGALRVVGGVGITGAVNIGGNTSISSSTASTSTTTGALVVTGGAGIGGTLNIGGNIRAGTNTFSKAGLAAGDVLLDNGTVDTPGLLFYWGNNRNIGIDTFYPGTGTTRFRIVRELNESGGAELWSVDRNGIVTQTAWAPGETIKTQTYNNTELSMSVSDPVSITSSSYTTIATASFTPLSSSSYLWIEFSATYDYNNGTAADEFAANIEVGGTEIINVFQKFINGSGGGTRSGVLFPLSGRYTNTGTSTLTITVRVKRNSGDDPIRVFGNAGSGLMRIQEIGR